jgi:hypothetical protein
MVLCVAVPVMEAFDNWDHTLQDGNDTEANVVIAALCIGLALTAATTIIACRLPLVQTNARFQLKPVVVSLASCQVDSPPPTASPPPLPLRI